MATTIANNSKDFVSNLIRKEFDSLSDSDIIIGKADTIIEAAKYYGLNDLSEQMKNDLN